MPLRRVLSRGRDWAMFTIATRAWARGIVVPLLGVVVFRIFVFPLQDAFPQLLSGSWAVELPYDLAAAAVSFFVVRSTLTWGVPVMMNHVRAIAVSTQSPRRAFLQKLATERIGETRVIVEKLAGDGYRAEDPAALVRWFEQFFQDGGPSYIGVDSHLPSQYWDEYDWYLRTHAESLESRDYPTTDVRILTTSQNDVSRDYRTHYAAFQEFYRWHEDRNVQARWLDADQADDLRTAYGVGNADIALWDKFAVLFTPIADSDAVTLSMVFPGGQRGDLLSYELLKEYVAKVQVRAMDLAQAGGRLDLVDRELARKWEAYVDPDARHDRGLAELLDRELHGKTTVLDAAGGIGTESVYLRSCGYSVFTNEVDSRLADEARAYADRRNVRLKLWRYTWETLPVALQEHEGNLRFDAILCLGNSLCLVEDEDGMRTCLDAFREALVDGGVLIIDERNFQYMLNHSEEILTDPVANFRPTLNGDVMYRGLDVRGYPVKIAPDAIHWRFFSNETPRVTRADQIPERKLGSNDLVLYPLRHGVLHGLLRSAGFGDIAVYADFELVARGSEMPTISGIGDAAFITYVARRSGWEGGVRPADGAARAVKTASPHGPGA
jgi:hypothetical protein